MKNLSKGVRNLLMISLGISIAMVIVATLIAAKGDYSMGSSFIMNFDLFVIQINFPWERSIDLFLSVAAIPVAGLIIFAVNEFDKLCLKEDVIKKRGHSLVTMALLVLITILSVFLFSGSMRLETMILALSILLIGLYIFSGVALGLHGDRVYTLNVILALSTFMGAMTVLLTVLSMAPFWVVVVSVMLGVTVPALIILINYKVVKFLKELFSRAKK